MGNNNDINNNSRFVQLDMDNSTNEQKLEWLCKIIDNELEKPEGEINNELILECYNCIDELTPENEKHTPEELAANLERIKTKATGNDNSAIVITVKPKKHFAIKVVAIIAAAFLLMFATLSVAAVANGYSNAFEYVSAKVSELLRMKPGDRINDNGITIIRNGKTQSYNNIEELLKAENLDIMYPSVLPEGVVIKQVSLIPENDDTKYRLILISSSESINIKVFNYYKNDLSLISGNEYTTADGRLFEWVEMEDGKYQAYCQHNGFEYDMISDSYDNMLIILDNMKEIEQ